MRKIPFIGNVRGRGAFSGDVNLLRIVLLFVICVPCLHAVQPGEEYVEGEVLVKFRAGHSVAASPSLQVKKRFEGLSRRRGGEVALVSLPGRSAGELAAELRRNPSVELVSFNHVRRVAARLPGNDSRFRDVWALLNTGQVVSAGTGTPGADIKWIPAMRLLQPTGEVVVAVIDTGVAFYHLDLRNRVWTNSGEIPTNGIDDDGNGYVDDLHGHDFSSAATGPDDDAYGHGTQAAGIIAAEWNNAETIAGVCQQARIMALRVFDGSGNGTDAQIIEAIDYAVMMKTSGVPVAVINASWGSYDDATMLGLAIADAGDAGIVFCAAAGNDAVNNDVQPFQPASLTNFNIIAVAASDQDDALWNFSNYGAATVDIAAPGVNNLGLIPRGSAVTTAAGTNRGIMAYYSSATAGTTGLVYDCGHGFATSFPSAVSGHIALIRGGLIANTSKVANAMAAGASCAVIYNDTPGISSVSLQHPAPWIATLSISHEDGLALLAQAPLLAVVIVYGRVDFEVGFSNGTSWAAPHVAGALALLALAHPHDNVTQRIARVLAAAHQTPALTNKCATHGRLDLARSLDTDSDGIGDWWELRHATNLVTLTGATDSDSDGILDADEFAADTNPFDSASHLRIAGINTPADTNIVLRWAAAPTRIYNLHTTTNLAAAWTPARTGIVAVLPDTIVTNHGNFFRLELDW